MYTLMIVITRAPRWIYDPFIWISNHFLSLLFNLYDLLVGWCVVPMAWINYHCVDSYVLPFMLRGS